MLSILLIELKGKAPLSVNLAATASPPAIRPITVKLPRAPCFNWNLEFRLPSSLSSSRNNLFIKDTSPSRESQRRKNISHLSSSYLPLPLLDYPPASRLRIPPSWPPRMFATCSTCPRMGNQDRQRSRKLSRRDQVSLSLLILISSF